MAYPHKPLIGVICNFREEDRHQMHTVGHRFFDAIINICQGVPIAIPALGDSHDVDATLQHLDGVILTGGRSNVEPRRYNGPASRDYVEHDANRDGTAMQLVTGAIAHHVPIFGVCRGIQEINVALGGTLYQHLHEVEGRFDHRMERHQPFGERLRPRQRISIKSDGRLYEIYPRDTEIVNTLHGQGIDALAPGLQVEALADDGTIEAVSLTDHPNFAIGVQWHAEYEPEDHALYRALFAAFGAAASARMTRRLNLDGLSVAAE